MNVTICWFKRWVSLNTIIIDGGHFKGVLQNIRIIFESYFFYKPVRSLECFIFWLVLGCFALHMLVKICIFQLICMKTKKGKNKKKQEKKTVPKGPKMRLKHQGGLFHYKIFENTPKTFPTQKNVLPKNSPTQRNKTCSFLYFIFISFCFCLNLF